MGQCADGYVVDTRLGQLTDVGQRDTPRGFDLGSGRMRTDRTHRIRNLIHAHIVKHYPVDGGGQRRPNFVQIPGLDFDLDIQDVGVLHTSSGRLDST